MSHPRYRARILPRCWQVCKPVYDAPAHPELHHQPGLRHQKETPGERLVPQGLYDRVVGVLGHEGITDVIVLMGYYTSVSLTMNFYAVPAGSPGLAR